MKVSVQWSPMFMGDRVLPLQGKWIFCDAYLGLALRASPRALTLQAFGPQTTNFIG
jgi:hypothetical protein